MTQKTALGSRAVRVLFQGIHKEQLDRVALVGALTAPEFFPRRAVADDRDVLGGRQLPEDRASSAQETLRAPKSYRGV
jgi:hypothetical protein